MSKTLMKRSSSRSFNKPSLPTMVLRYVLLILMTARAAAKMAPRKLSSLKSTVRSEAPYWAEKAY